MPRARESELVSLAVDIGLMINPVRGLIKARAFVTGSTHVILSLASLWGPRAVDGAEDCQDAGEIGFGTPGSSTSSNGLRSSSPFFEKCGLHVVGLNDPGEPRPSSCLELPDSDIRGEIELEELFSLFELVEANFSLDHDAKGEVVGFPLVSAEAVDLRVDGRGAALA